MAQRVMIAMALSCDPVLLIADEPTTALDVTIQAQILELLDTLKRDLNLAMILITHDLGVVAGVADRVNVMYAGSIVESGATRDVFHHPRHHYTAGLLRAVPRLDRPAGSVEPIGGRPVAAGEVSGCAFRTRCGSVSPQCEQEPPLVGVSKSLVACWHPVVGES
jgi:oligopeptide/dipeptide ABC transporter ATP-binding protein